MPALCLCRGVVHALSCIFIIGEAALAAGLIRRLVFKHLEQVKAAEKQVLRMWPRYNLSAKLLTLPSSKVWQYALEEQVLGQRAPAKYVTKSKVGSMQVDAVMVRWADCQRERGETSVCQMLLAKGIKHLADSLAKFVQI